MPYAPAEKAHLFYEGKGRGDPLLLIMGFGGTHHAWVAQVPAFRRHFRTITYDSRGLGRSRDTGEPYSLSTLASDALALLDNWRSTRLTFSATRLAAPSRFNSLLSTSHPRSTSSRPYR